MRRREFIGARGVGVAPERRQWPLKPCGAYRRAKDVHPHCKVLPLSVGRSDLAEMIDASLPKPGPCGPYEKAEGLMRKHRQGLEGRIVQVIDGPFTGFRGEVKDVDEQTVKVDVQAYGRVTTMDLALRQLELVPKNSN
jgi:RNase P/RNase MRP subunit p29